MPTYRDKGIVLRAKAVREADRHYSVFTESHGKVLLLAKGTRRSRSTMSPHMASFGVVDIMVAKGKVMDRLAGAGLVRPHRSIAGSLERTAHAQGLLLAVDELTRSELPEPRIFALLSDYLHAIDTVKWPEGGGRSMVFDAAMARLLDILGFGLELDECVGCRAAATPEGNAMNILRGGLECAACRRPGSFPVGEEAIKALRFLRTAPFEDVGRLVAGAEARRQVGFVTDILATSHLEAKFDPLRYLRTVS